MIEAPNFIREAGRKISHSRAVEFLRERAVSKRNAIDDAGFVSRIILAGVGVESALTGNIGLTAAAVLIYPLDVLITESTVMVCDTKSYIQRQRERYPKNFQLSFFDRI